MEKNNQKAHDEMWTKIDRMHEKLTKMGESLARLEGMKKGQE